ncbi:MAG: LLM class F420-dependent oxidoreductase [Chromatiales bacterium]|jgi:probable F420-dependent oxidoreductase|nr:LLM class F420-dependent oxidoreductase [Chromatiales bacterium]
MKVGIFCAFSDVTPADVIAQQVRAIEERGFHSIWVPEHAVMFEQYQSRYPYAEDGRLPSFGTGVMEPFTALSFVAAHTQRVRLGTGVCLVPQRNPVYTAKQVADVDFLSGGRVDFGVGIGWLREEFDALQMPWPKRALRVREHLAVMKALWAPGTAQYDGELYSLPPCVQSPKPVQTPHPPILFGGEGDPALRRVAEVGQGWLGAKVTPEQVPVRLARLDELLAEAGRSRADITVNIMPNIAPQPDLLPRYEDEGVDQVIHMVGGRDLESYLPRLDRLAKMAFG